MSLLREITLAAVDSNSDLASLLRKCKLLAANLGSTPLEEWLVWESNGYPDQVPVPAYRSWPLEIRGQFAGPFGMSLSNITVPTACIPASHRDLCHTFNCRPSIGAIEASLRESGSGTRSVQMGDLFVLLGRTVIQGYNCIAAWGMFGDGQLVEVLNAVRNRVLDFALAVGREFPSLSADGVDNPTPPSDRITQLFQTTIYGGSAQIVAPGTLFGPMILVHEGDFESMKRALTDRGITEQDVDDLREALDADPPPTPSSRYGPRLAAWVGRMTSKAASGAWDISVAAAGEVLSQVLSKYYGLPG